MDSGLTYTEKALDLLEGTEEDANDLGEDVQAALERVEDFLLGVQNLERMLFGCPTGL